MQVTRSKAHNSHYGALETITHGTAAHNSHYGALETITRVTAHNSHYWCTVQWDYSSLAWKFD